MIRRIAAGALGLLLLAAGLFFTAGPAAIERALNRVVPHRPHPVRTEALALHATIPVADLHADPLLWNRDLTERGDRGHTDLPRLRAGGVALQVFGVVTSTPAGQNYERNEADSSDTTTLLAIAQRWPLRTWGSRFERAVYQIEKLHDLDRRSGHAFHVVATRADLEAVLALRAQGIATLGGVLAIEGAHALDGELGNLAKLHERGLRVVGLTHFFDNRIGGSLHGTSGEGLSDFGRSVVTEAARRRMVIDVAHASPRMVRDVLAMSERPVILSHGGFAGVCKSARNLDDALMQEIAAHAGLIGVGYWDGAICDISPRGVAKAIRYGIRLLGVDQIALGSDYDGATEVAFDGSELAVLTEALLDAGLAPDEIRKVMGENVVRFFLEQLP